MPFSSSRPWTTEEETDGIDVASILNTIPTRTWDAAADSLLETGVATSKYLVFDLCTVLFVVHITPKRSQED